MSNTFYITTPIYYVNDVPHIGHAYTTVAADVLARYRRLTGYDVFFLTGLDEHGQKVQEAATKAGIDPQAYCDGMAPRFQNLWKRLNISNDAFIRTTHPRHQQIVQRTLQTLHDKKLIYRGDYTGWYCTFDERFWTEKDVVDGLCPDCRRPVEQLSESNYFFRMSQYQTALRNHIGSHPQYIAPSSRRNEVLGFLDKPLNDLSISRPKSRLSWGIELPFDTNYVTYVWFDALVNYLSGPEYLLPTPSVNRYWPATLHLVGKDILTTHAVYWSTILMALELPLPKTIFAHGWWTVNGEKMSKSRGNVVDPYAMVDEFGTDAFRYFLLREVPFGHDGDFSREALIGRINSDLANGLGNLLNRTLTLIERFSHGVIPEPMAAAETDLDKELQRTALSVVNEKLRLAFQLSTKAPVESEQSKLALNQALEAIWGLVQLGNQYIDKTAAWTLAKRPEDQARLHTVLYHATEALRFLSVALYPFTPETSEEMKRQLGLVLNFSKPLLAGDLQWGGLLPGTKVAKGKTLFPRIDITAKTQGEVRVTTPDQQNSDPKEDPTKTAASRVQSGTGQISMEDFLKVQLKAAKVLSAERVPKSEKLLKLQVDLGNEQRQIVAGIGKRYEPDQLVGRRVVIVANLKPAKLMGVESQGMILAAGDHEVGGLVTILEEVDPGTKVK
ncbi:MAG: methionine--tRNA ligase [Nitrospirota bacterium]|nr:methionine--tRNA ligase [Nitrospirota bacterium]